MNIRIKLPPKEFHDGLDRGYMRNKELTLKQLKFVKHYFECNGNGTEAARFAGYKGNQDVLGVVAFGNLRNPNIQAAVKKLYVDKGLTEDNLLKKHVHLLNATRRFTVGGVEVKSPDNSVRLGALKLAYEVTGRLTKKIEHSGEVKLTEEEKIAKLIRLKAILSDCPI